MEATIRYPLRSVQIYEVDFAPGCYQWECVGCNSVGNVVDTTGFITDLMKRHDHGIE